MTGLGRAGARTSSPAHTAATPPCPADGASVAVRLLLSALIRDSSDSILVPIPQASAAAPACLPACAPLGGCSASLFLPACQQLMCQPRAGAGATCRLVLIAARPSSLLPCLPLPQYPLYSASIQLYGGTLLPYNLKEASGWSMDFNEITRSVHDARCVGGWCVVARGAGSGGQVVQQHIPRDPAAAAAARSNHTWRHLMPPHHTTAPHTRSNAGANVRVLVFINPGNPTGQCLTEDNLKDLVRGTAGTAGAQRAQRGHRQRAQRGHSALCSCFAWPGMAGVRGGVHGRGRGRAVQPREPGLGQPSRAAANPPAPAASSGRSSLRPRRRLC